MSISKRNSEGYLDITAYQALKIISNAEERKAKAKGRGYRPIVYICSPYSGDIEGNTRKAIAYTRYASDVGCIPITPHLLFPRFLDDSIEEERELGILYSKVLMNFCRELWVFGEDISLGMRSEIDKARRKGMPIRHFDSAMKEIRDEHESINASRMPNEQDQKELRCQHMEEKHA